ncbi:MAG: GNAT family N-acetyltransferase [Actinomycetota bacterium]|nr:GNAT family N-acetyltransferase [Actinomycetota bacterium]
MSLIEPVQPLTRPRKPTAAERRAVAETLAAAFFDDPVIRWAWHNPQRRRQILPDFFELMVTGSLAHDEVYTTDDLAGAALWLPPAALQPSDGEAADFAAAVERVTHEFTPAVLQLFATLEEHHPHEPHYYLPIIGTRPEHQGRGIGSALLAPVLERCDQDEVPAYLEATSERNQALYVRHGFQVTDEIPLPGGPTLWAMWREPAAIRN